MRVRRTLRRRCCSSDPAPSGAQGSLANKERRKDRAARSLPSMRSTRNAGSDVLDERRQRPHTAHDVPGLRRSTHETSPFLRDARAMDGRANSPS
jgi:hypothetical protein